MNNQARTILSILLLLPIHVLVAQTGPGGVGNATGAGSNPRNIVWLDASDLTAPLSDGFTWPDKSGNGYDAIETTTGSASNFPSLGNINGVPALDFGGVSSEYLIIPDDDSGADLLDNAPAFTVFAVYTVGNDDPRCIISKRISFTNQMAYTIFHNAGFKAYTYVSNSTYGGGSTVSSGQNYIQGFRSNSSVATNSVNLYLNGDNFDNGGSNVSILDNSSNVTIGLFNEGDGRYFKGKIAEIVMYRDALSEVELMILQNYLAAKYDINIANSYYSFESTHGGDVIGIGQASDGSNHTTSQGDGILEISNASGLGNGEFLFVGHNGEEVAYRDTCDLPGIYGKRLSRVWRADETGDVGSLGVSFDLSSLSGLGSQNELALLVSSSSSFANATVHTAGRNLSGSTLSFTGLNLAAGDYFTIAQEGIHYSSGSWNNGSGGGNAPSVADAGKKISINGTIALSSDAACECLELSIGNTLTINSGQSLTVEEALVNEGSIVIENSGSLVQTSVTNVNSGSGTYSVTRNTGTLADNTRYQYWGTPVTSANMSTVFSNSNVSDFYHFNAGTQQWQAATSMTPGKGYITTGDANGGTNFSQDITFSGTINNAISVLATSASSGGYLLLGNPYPSAISSSSFVGDNTGEIDGTLYFWNHTSSGTNSDVDYASWNLTGSTISRGGNNVEAPDDYIQSMQGFFVEATSNNPSIVFNNSQRTAGNNTQFFKRSTQEKRQRIWLNLTNDTNDFNQLLIGFMPDATKGKDRLYDGKKFKAHPRVAFYSMLGNDELAIQGLPYIFPGEEESIALGVDTWIEGTYSIDLDSLDNWPSHYAAWLEDKEEDTLTAITDLPYTFEVDTLGVIKNRFRLVVKRDLEEVGGAGIETPDAPGPSTGVEEAEEDWIKIYAVHQELRLEASQQIKQYTMYDVSGRMVETRTISSTNASQRIHHNGLYLIELELENGEKRTQKVVF